jgi:hypothetical protein
LRLRKEGVVGEVVGVKVGFDSFEVRHAFSDDSGSVFGITELKSRLWSHFSVASATELGWWRMLV